MTQPKDMQRFLIYTQVKNADTHPLFVILNWDAEMVRRWNEAADSGSDDRVHVI